MQFNTKEPDPLYGSIEPVVRGLGMALVELTVSRHRGSVTIRVIVTRTGAEAATGLTDCAGASRAIVPVIELALNNGDFFLEVSSPGIDRIIKHAGEFRWFTGRILSCYRTDISAWTSGVLESAGDNYITVRENGKMVQLDYGIIGKAKLGGVPTGSGNRQKDKCRETGAV
ncbi:MAG: ribosome assembly cofactor RimP [Spirochaetaceae bacterium]|jgi:ribosome maturation factor RimP|nr:ribosome assembly cofactor RimP [Spirochaetaceae bacterium]